MKTINNLESSSPECLGNLFPPIDEVRYNKQINGVVFGMRLESTGIGVSDKELTFDAKAWKECRKCPHFEECYQLSMAKLAFVTSVRNTFHI